MRKFWFFTLYALRLTAQNPYENPHTSIDVEHYVFRILLRDSSDQINGETTLRLHPTVDSLASVALDLVNQDDKMKGMKVRFVLVDEHQTTFTHQNNLLQIKLPHLYFKNQTFRVDVAYEGEPKDGLIISTNKFGERTFFGDNWPNRARNWLPVVDHPSDKATCEWVVTAPLGYKVVANGAKKEQIKVTETLKMTRYLESVPISTKIMVLGAARFAMQEAGKPDNISVQSWLFPQDSTQGFIDYAAAVPILLYYDSLIGTFPFEKLANVQSKTVFGGMENAGAIFYSENEIYGYPNVNMDGLLAHEMAHQWFGDCVTEKNFGHLWLSEGFATYLSAEYIAQKWGRPEMDKIMMANRLTALGFMDNNPELPVVDTLETDLMNLLNANSYQKGAWVLHMLRRELGEAHFWNGLNRFYNVFRNQNADTHDFQENMEKISGKDLSVFFKQWLYQPAYPELRFRWSWENKTHQLKWKLDQVQSGLNIFQFPLTIGIFDAKGNLIQKEDLRMDQKSQEGSIELSEKPFSIQLDPEHWLLFKGKVEAL